MWVGEGIALGLWALATALVAVAAAFAVGVVAADRLDMSLSLGQTGVFEATVILAVLGLWVLQRSDT